jgi:hypothetical protein
MSEPTGADERPQPVGARPPGQPSTGAANPPVPAQSGVALPPVPPSGAHAPRGRWKGLAAALAVGLIVGGGIGAGTVAAITDPTESDEYQELAAQLDTERGRDAVDAEESDSPSTSAAPSSSAADDDQPRLAQVGQTAIRASR